jgi:hypothetical protein
MNHHAYLNTILFPQTSVLVDAQYISGLEHLMYSKNWIEGQETQREEYPQQPNVQTPPTPTPTPPLTSTPTLFVPKQRNTLFWSIYTNENPGELNQTNPVMTEVGTRMEIVESLRSQPKRLKDTNSKLTLEQTQALYGAMLVAQEDDISFCTAYSVHYKKNILLVYPNTYRIYSPSVSVDIEDDDHVIIIYVQKKTYGTNSKSKTLYAVDLSPSKEKALNIMEEKVNSVLNAQTKYSIAELEEIATKLNLQSKMPDGKKRKKQELYDDIRVAISRC